MNYRHTSKSRYMQQKKRRRKQILRVVRFAIFVTLCVVAFVYGRLAFDLGIHGNTFYPGISLDGIQLTGYGKEDVAQQLNQAYADRFGAQRVLLTFQDQQWTFTPADVSASRDVSALVEQAWSLGHDGGWFERQAAIRALRSQPAEFQSELTYDEQALDNYINQIKQLVDKPVKNATVTITSEDTLKVGASETGYELNAQDLKQQLVALLYSGESRTIELQPEVIQPSISEEELESSTVKIAGASTSLKRSSANRSHNVELSLLKFNGMVVQDGQKVSFNKVVGARTKANGFLEAAEYAGTEVVEGVGGGACQASTTLYNAVLKAGLQINERHNHGMTVGYAKLSLDAAVFGTKKDFVFTNNTGHTIFIFAGVKDKKAYVNIYGTPKDDIKITLESETIKDDITTGKKRYENDTSGKHVYYTTDEPVLKSEGKKGAKSKGYRVYTRISTGEVIKRELLSTDTYAAQPDTYWKGIHDLDEELF